MLTIWYLATFTISDHSLCVTVCRYSIRGQLMCSTKANKIKIDYPTGICRAHTSGGDYIVVCEWGKMRLLLLNETLDTVIRYFTAIVFYSSFRTTVPFRAPFRCTL